MKRIWCFLFHWKRQQRFSETHYYGWQCAACGERWRVARGPEDDGQPEGLIIGTQSPEKEWLNRNKK